MMRLFICKAHVGNIKLSKSVNHFARVKLLLFSQGIELGSKKLMCDLIPEASLGDWVVGMALVKSYSYIALFLENIIL